MVPGTRTRGGDEPRDPDDLHEVARDLLARVDGVVLGKHETVELALATMLAGGHMLFEDIPGVGKTTVALAFARLMGLACTRVQFTPDVTPSDVVGFSMPQPGTGSFEYRPGAVFCNLLLADEINRTSPKTQAALLEVMEERSVTVDGLTRRLPEPFFVIATQNPLGSAGTQPLPPSQLDRFMASASMGYPSFDDELEMALATSARRRTDGLQACMDAGALPRMQRAAQGVFVHDEVGSYAVDLVRATRESRLFDWGASPRATIALVRLARALAWLRGGDYVLPADVDRAFAPVARHRVGLSAAARADGLDAGGALARVASGVARPRLVGTARIRRDGA